MASRAAGVGARSPLPMRVRVGKMSALNLTPQARSKPYRRLAGMGYTITIF